MPLQKQAPVLIVADKRMYIDGGAGMNRIRQPDSVQDYPDTVQQLLDIDRETDDMPDVEGVHQGVILSETWGNE